MPEDKEYEAIGAVIRALDSLDEKQKNRVMDYVAKRFALDTAGGESQVTNLGDRKPAQVPNQVVSESTVRDTKFLDIRTLKEQKNPKSANQMAVLVAYYLKELTQADRKDVIGSDDIETYFNQAGFPLPTGKNGATDTLNNAKKAGYFESAGTGLFRLNPVGFNLAAYNMPTESVGTKKSRKPAGKHKSRR